MLPNIKKTLKYIKIWLIVYCYIQYQTKKIKKKNLLRNIKSFDKIEYVKYALIERTYFSVFDSIKFKIALCLNVEIHASNYWKNPAKNHLEIILIISKIFKQTL